MKKILIIIAAAILGACNYLDIDPVGQVVPHTVADYRALLTKAYDGPWSAKKNLAWPSDEVGDISLTNGFRNSSLMNATWRAENLLASEYAYMDYFKAIFYANEIITNVMSSEQAGSTESKKQVLAEAYVMRAYCYFDLVNIYAKWYDPNTAKTDLGVPVTTIIDVKQQFPRSTVEQVYDQIFADIKAARENMEVESYPIMPTYSYNYRFSGRSLTALEARVALYHGDWQTAFNKATSLISQVDGNFKLVDLVSNPKQVPFSSKSSEAIQALDRVSFVGFDLDETLVSENIIALYKEGDVRIKKYYEQFELSTPDFMLSRDAYRYVKKERVSFRLSEMYLIAAEAALKNNAPSLSDARTYLGDLQKMRIAAGNLPDINTMSVDQLIQEVADERARELLGEGHRWFDLRRTTRPAITKKIVTEWYLDFDLFEEVRKTETYTLNKDDQRYILPFPRSAKEINPYLN